MLLQEDELWYFFPPFVGIHTIFSDDWLGSFCPHTEHFPLEYLCPAVAPSFAPQTLHVLGAVHVASFHLWPLAFPSFVPQVAQVLGAVQVAAFQLWSAGFPSVAPQTVQVLGVVQVAAFQL